MDDTSSKHALTSAPPRDTEEDNSEAEGAGSRPGQSPAWDEGLTPEERAQAKRRYKNWKGVERWRRRKQVQREANQKSSTSRDDAANQSSSTGTGGTAQDASQGGPPSSQQQAQEQAEGEAQSVAAATQPLAKAAVGEELGLVTEDLEGESKSEKDTSPTDVVENEWSDAQRMLFEFSKLGKTEETKLKSLLDNIASFALVPHGFQRHKDRIVRLSEEVLSITRNGRPSTANVAQRFLQWGINFNKEWEDPAIPNVQQVLRVFASRGDQSTFVKVPLQNGQHKTISLQQLSQMDEVVHTELYIDLVQQILREMPKATAEGPEVRKKARNFIARNMKQASMVASGYVIGHFLSFAGLRATRKHAAVPVQGMLYATSALELNRERCRELWRVYDKAQADLRPLLERHQALEQQLDALLAMHDISSDSSYHSILSAVELLMQNFEEQFNVSYFADLKCSHELLTPLEMGFIAAAQVPKLTSNQVLAQKLDPYTRMYLIFECGAVPRI